MISRKRPIRINEIFAAKGNLFDTRINRDYNLNVTYGGSNNLLNDVCFRRIDDIFRKRITGKKVFYYFLPAKRKDLFDYESLISELQAMFKGGFTIRAYRYKRSAYLLEFQEKQHVNKNLALYTYTALFALIRALDTEFTSRWEGQQGNYPVKTWKDTVLGFYLQTSKFMGHGINDDLATILSKYGVDSDAGKKAVDSFLAIFTYLFSEKKKVYLKLVTRIRRSVRPDYYFSQTPAYRFLEKLTKALKEGVVE